MKIIISPTKKMKRKDYKIKETTPLFLDKSKGLRSILESYNLQEIKDLFKTSDKLSKKVYDYFQKPKEATAAINLYEGLAFKNMDVEIWTQADFDFIEDKIIILSALYGALRISDKIKEYRLDYMVKFEKDLYDYWKSDLEKLFRDEDYIVNLASNEFSKGISHPKMINIYFLNEKGKNQSTGAKIARGQMIKYIVKNKIEDVNELKDFKLLNYKFNKNKSDENNYYFKKK